MTQLLTDETTFVTRLQRHRRELHVHCYRMLGSFDHADDVVDEALRRASRRRDLLDSGPWFRAWLYRIATDACIDALERSRRRAPSVSSSAEPRRLQPYPDRLLDEITPDRTGDDDAEPGSGLLGDGVVRGTIELAYVAAIQLLPPRQRAALILRDVLGWSMRETAGLLDTTIVAANSALQRARATLPTQRPAGRGQWTATEPNADERVVLERFIVAHERADAFGDWRFVPTAANRQPAAAGYFRAPDASEYLPCRLDVLRIEEGVIAEITTFDTRLFEAFGLPLAL